MPLTPDQYTGHEDYSRFGASAAGLLDSFMRKPPSKRTPLDWYRLMDALIDCASSCGIELQRTRS